MGRPQILHLTGRPTDTLKIWRVSGVAFLFAASVAHWTVAYLEFDQYVGFLERLFSPDGSIKSPASALRSIQFALAWLAALLLLFPTLKLVCRRTRWGNSPISRKLLYLIICWLILSWQPFRNVFPAFYDEDGLYEYLTAGCAIAASCVFLIAAFRTTSVFRRGFAVTLCLTFFFFAMEEISWGQRLVGYQTPESLNKLNFQQEANLHNLIPSFYYQFLYVAVCASVSAICFYRDKIVERLKGSTAFQDARHLLPPSGISAFTAITFFVLIGMSSISGELVEIVWSLLGFAYAVHLMRSPTVEKTCQLAPGT